MSPELLASACLWFLAGIASALVVGFIARAIRAAIADRINAYIPHDDAPDTHAQLGPCLDACHCRLRSCGEGQRSLWIDATDCPVHRVSSF